MVYKGKKPVSTFSLDWNTQKIISDASLHNDMKKSAIVRVAVNKVFGKPVKIKKVGEC